MSVRKKIIRLVVGFLLVIVFLGLAFSALLPWIHVWGATEEELAREYPGDEILPEPQIQWTHGLTIHAPVKEVWPWIAQIGDTRGGYYSYTFIENMIAGYDMYHNADHIIDEFQNPQPGVEIIEGALQIREVKPGQWMLAESSFDFGWTWLWMVEPLQEGETRLLIRMNIKVAELESLPLVGNFIDLGGFVMERNMMYGIKERAEGRGEVWYIEPLEIALWFFALLVGLAAAWLFINRESWRLPFLMGICSTLVLFVLTFLQPAIWIRAVLDVALLAGLVCVIRSSKA